MDTSIVDFAIRVFLREARERLRKPLVSPRRQKHAPTPANPTKASKSRTTLMQSSTRPSSCSAWRQH